MSTDVGVQVSSLAPRNTVVHGIVDYRIFIFLMSMWVRILLCKTRSPPTGSFLLWRRVWDSNPRGREPKRFSRPPRYDHFDNSPNIHFFALVKRAHLKCALFLAQKEGFEPSRAFYTPTPLAGEPLRPLGYFCTLPLKYNSTTQRLCQEIYSSICRYI